MPYVLLDNNDIVQNTVVWDGVTPLPIPNGWVLHLLPVTPPVYNPGDTYNPNTDVVTPAGPTPQSIAAGNYQTIIGKATNAFVNNQTFLNLASPTQAQAVAQVQALTRQVNGLMRVMAQQLQTITDT